MKKTFISVLALVMTLVLLLSFSSCLGTQVTHKDPTDYPVVPTNPTDSTTPTDPTTPTAPTIPEDPKAPSIKVTAQLSEIRYGETIDLSVEILNTDDTDYTWTMDKAGILSIGENNVLEVIKEVGVDTTVTIKATLNSNPKISGSKTFIVRATSAQGAVGDLTSDMIKAISGPNITVSGTITDYYKDFHLPMNNKQTSYDMYVKMDAGKWFGSWNISENTDTVLEDYYRKSDKDGYKAQSGATGFGLEKIFINKNNEVEIKVEKDYLSMPLIWEESFLWNQLGSLDVNKFIFNETNMAYKYAFTDKEDDIYLQYYLSRFLTPCVDDPFVDFYFKVKDGKIVGIIAQTEVIYYGDDRENADAMSYTQVILDIKDVGTTTINDPSPYSAPDYADKLKSGLEKLRSATSYTMKTTDVQTYKPMGNEDDYSVMSYNSFTSSKDPGFAHLALATPNAIIIAKTTKYDYTMDGKNYKVDYTGFRQSADGTYYDEFAYDSTLNGFKGIRRATGSIANELPAFNFSENIFVLDHVGNSGGKPTYVFKLRDTNATRDVAMELAIYNARNAHPAVDSSLTITVDENGNILSARFPYDLVSGTYVGYCVVTYSAINSTTIDEDAFDNYEWRQVKDSWSDYTFNDYYYTHSTQQKEGFKQSADVVVEAIFGDKANNVPAPSVLLEIFGDNIHGPFFNYKEVGADAQGKPLYVDYFSFTAKSMNYDENSKITDYEDIIATITEKLTALGFKISEANTDTSGGSTGQKNRYICFIKDGVQIVIENNHTRFFWIYFYCEGDWTLN